MIFVNVTRVYYRNTRDDKHSTEYDIKDNKKNKHQSHEIFFDFKPKIYYIKHERKFYT